MILAKAWVNVPRVRVLIFIGMMFSACPTIFASIPTNNGVLQTSNAVEALLNSSDTDSLYSRCLTQGIGARYFSDSCTKLIDNLRKRMDVLALEADLQIQAEKIAKPILSKIAATRILLLSKINLLSTQAEDMIKASQNNSKNSDPKEDLPDILSSVHNIQALVANYSKLFANAAN